jgi:hypothetical protein
MKIVSGALAALLLAGIGWSVPAQAQGVPRGSYLRTCTDVGMRGDTLVATCRTGNGREQRTALRAVDRCVGDIGNNQGMLQCTYGGGGQERTQAPQQPGYGAPRYGEQPSGYGGYGVPR